jgi:hypothetical protein
MNQIIEANKLKIVDKDKINIGQILPELVNCVTVEFYNIAEIENIGLLSKYPKLNVLRFNSCFSFTGNSIFDEGIEEVCISNSNINLKVLPKGLRKLTIEAIDIRDLSLISRFQKLESLVLKNCDLLQDINGLSELAELMDLTILNCGLVSDLSGISNLKKIKKLTIGYCNNELTIPSNIKDLKISIEPLSSLIVSDGKFKFLKII